MSHQPTIVTRYFKLGESRHYVESSLGIVMLDINSILECRLTCHRQHMLEEGHRVVGIVPKVLKVEPKQLTMMGKDLFSFKGGNGQCYVFSSVNEA